MRVAFSTLALTALLGLGLPSGAAQALPIGGALSLAPAGIEPVRLVCDAFGRCVRTRPPLVRVVPGPFNGGVVIGRPRGPGVDIDIGGRGGRVGGRDFDDGDRSGPGVRGGNRDNDNKGDGQNRKRRQNAEADGRDDNNGGQGQNKRRRQGGQGGGPQMQDGDGDR